MAKWKPSPPHNANGASVAYTYDDLNRLSTVVDNNLPGQNTTSYTYDNASNVATVATPNGLQSSFTYDTLNRLTGLTTAGGKLQLHARAYGQPHPGHRSQRPHVNWSYDNIYRLTSETIASDPSQNNGSASYGLDPVGNRTSETSSLPGINSGIRPVYNADDQQISSETYDANGNVTKTANGNSYTYDSENHMIAMTAHGKSITMVYDAFGNRVAKTVNWRHHAVSRRGRRQPHRLPAGRRGVDRPHRRGSGHAHLHLRPAAHQREPKSSCHRQQRLDAELLRL